MDKYSETYRFRTLAARKVTRFERNNMRRGESFFLSLFNTRQLLNRCNRGLGLARLSKKCQGKNCTPKRVSSNRAEQKTVQTDIKFSARHMVSPPWEIRTQSPVPLSPRTRALEGTQSRWTHYERHRLYKHNIY